jgi:hypothetical protein
MPAAVAAVKKSSKYLVRTAIPSAITVWLKAGSSDRSISPSTILTKASTPTARTSGSAYGSLINGFGPLDANARPAATPVAVAPTLDAGSHVSLSVLAMCLLSSRDDGQ